jgi:hypothetical protein
VMGFRKDGLKSRTPSTPSWELGWARPTCQVGSEATGRG